ncbi:MAG: peptidoglycan DD-metalloendopeptidase family protein [Ruminococcus sp.]|nr:peptidoglycan DD-metalloendopeptidase family protein [Ruminococcus sp.]
MIKRILSCIICLSMVIGCVLTASATDIDEIKDQQAALEEKSAEYQAILDEKNAEVAQQQEYVDALVGKVETVTQEIQLSHQKIQALDEDIAEKTEQINQKNAEIEENMDILRQRIKTIYIAGEVSSLEIIMGAKNFSDFLDKVQLVKSVSAHDEELINEIQAQLDQISAEKEELQLDKVELEEEEKNLKAKQDELNVLLRENEQTLATLQEESDELLAQLTLTEDQISQLDEELQEYYRQQQQQGGGSAVIIPPIDVPAGGGYVWPCPGFYNLTSQYEEWRGYYNHGAIDIASGGIMGAAVVAAAGGTVVATCTSCPHNWGKYYSCGCGGGYGNYVWINHGNGKETVYAHLTSVAVSTGQYVSAGQLLGTVGSTGHSTGAHLHFETRYNGVKYDPMSEY